MRSPYEHGISMVAFTWSGYLPLLMFRHVSGRSLLVIRQNAAMLYHRSITPLDLVIARCGLELLGAISAAVVSFTVFYMFGWLPWPKDMGMLLLGFFYMAWWSFAVGLIVAGGSERSEMVEHIWMTISYVYIPISGFMYLAQWLPASVRGLALAVLPSLHSYEMIRSGVFGNNIQTFYNVAYVSFYLAVLTVIGLWLIHSVRRHLEIEF
jgi:capsular polysaccharide transport system permease protein